MTDFNKTKIQLITFFFLRYEHPYKFELDMYDATPWTDAAREPITFPAPLKNTNFRFVNTLGKLEALVRHLREVDEFAVDVEHHSHRSYTGNYVLIISIIILIL